MATWTDIASTDVDQDSPVTSSLMIALRDNPQAIADRAMGNSSNGAPQVRYEHSGSSSGTTVFSASGTATTTASTSRFLLFSYGSIYIDYSITDSQSGYMRIYIYKNEVLLLSDSVNAGTSSGSLTITGCNRGDTIKILPLHSDVSGSYDYSIIQSENDIMLLIDESTRVLTGDFS